jgi:RimJ/RimL family protein N-acetyltransferase
MEARYWPLFDLRIRTPRLELRPPTDADLTELAAVAAAGIHDADRLPFMVPWTDQPSPRLERGLLQWVWRRRAEWSPEEWGLGLAVYADGEPAGFQDINAKDFAKLGVVETGSWLGRGYQGRGIGTEMRAAVLHFAFAGLGAAEALSGAWHDNVASRRVSEKNAYEENGQHRMLRRDESDEQVHYRLTRERWQTRGRDDIAIEGLDSLLPWFGAAPADGTWWPTGD